MQNCGFCFALYALKKKNPTEMHNWQIRRIPEPKDQASNHPRDGKVPRAQAAKG